MTDKDSILCPGDPHIQKAPFFCWMLVVLFFFLSRVGWFFFPNLSGGELGMQEFGDSGKRNKTVFQRRKKDGFKLQPL